MKKLAFVAALATATVSAPAMASGYAGAEGGYAWVDIKAKQTAQELANLSGSTVTYTHDKAAFMGRLFGGYDISPNLALEVGGFTTGNLSATYTITGASASESYSASGLDVSIVLKPSPEGFYAKLGMHNSKVSGNASLVIGGVTYAVASTTKSGTGVMGGIGYQSELSPNLYWQAGWTYYGNLGGISSANANFISFGVTSKF